ncbi:hypothetical protein CQZ93_25575 [Ochrobactrum vermis]|nr:hypothetical protein CQZ93_25575 [Ochrobactrum vermis]
MTDYYLIKRERINTDALFDDRSTGEYYYSGGYNSKAIMSLVVSGFITICVSVVPAFSAWAAFSWPIGVVASMAIYYAVSGSTRRLNAQARGD